MNHKKYKLVLWGLGKEYNAHLNLLKVHEALGDIEIVALTANDVPNYQKLDGWNIKKSCEIKYIDFDYIIVFNEKFFKDIISNIMELGIERKRILPGRIIDIPYFSWDKYLSVYNSQLSIISSNCWGGVIYKTLGMECNSPFKNLWVDPGELCSNYCNLNEILQYEPQFVRWAEDAHSHQEYPVGKIGTMEIHFNHDSVFSEAVSKWNRRLAKVNYGNLFLEIYTDRESVVEKFLNLMNDGIQGVCFIPYECKCDYESEQIYRLKLLPGQSEFYEVVNSNASYGRNGFIYDIFDMLQGNKRYRVED